MNSRFRFKGFGLEVNGRISPHAAGGAGSCCGPSCELGHQAFPDVDQVVGDHTKAYPALHPLHAVAAAAGQSVTTLQDADSALHSVPKLCLQSAF